MNIDTSTHTQTHACVRSVRRSETTTTAVVAQLLLHNKNAKVLKRKRDLRILSRWRSKREICL